MLNSTPALAHLLEQVVKLGGSDLHVVPGVKPMIRIDGSLRAVEDQPVVTVEEAELMLTSILSEQQRGLLPEKKELDLSIPVGEARFRVNVFRSQGALAGAFRHVPREIRNLRELGLPTIIESFARAGQGLVLITGPTGHGKSTTLAAIVEIINTERNARIITIEDPIEYIFDSKKSVTSQRGLGSDTNSFARALRSALREDPDVVLIGEMRDLETIEAALTIAETGHLVLSTLHTNSAAQTVDRIIDSFPAVQQRQVRQQLGNVLSGVVSQRLIPKIQGGRAAAAEVMIANFAVKNTIREGKTHQLSNIIQTSAAEGMIAIDKVLAELVSRGEITIESALLWAQDQKNLKTMIY